MKINNVNLVLTTKCNRTCPDCFANCPNIKGKDISWEDMEKAIEAFKGFDTITLTGGEAALHKQFSKWVPKLKELFGCRSLELETNGYALDKIDIEVLKCFDLIYVSDYGDNTTKKEGLNIWVFDVIDKHIPKDHRNSGTCFRGTCAKCSYAFGKIFRCCSSYPMENQEGLEPCEDWLNKIDTQVSNCKECLFAGTKI